MYEPKEYSVCNDRYTLSTTSQEMRMSHWVDTPIVRDKHTQKIVLDLSNTSWHLLEWEEDSSDLTLTLAKYPSLADRHKVYFNFASMLARFDDEDFSFRELSMKLKNWY